MYTTNDFAAFLEKLQMKNISFNYLKTTKGELIVLVYRPGYTWKFIFNENGIIDIKKFVTGFIDSEKDIETLITNIANKN